jgi:two-component system sensor histidine kinase PilS (NtrC family)
MRDQIDLKNLIEDTLDLFVHNPEWTNGVDIQKDLADGIRLNANPEQIRQILWNLLVNAIQAMPEGGTVTITSKIVDENQGQWKRDDANSNYVDKMESPRTPYIEINIKDTGTGIITKNLDRIFDPFFTTKDNGTGLGLAIVYRMIENYQGNITVQSELEKGSMFIVRLPFNK